MTALFLAEVRGGVSRDLDGPAGDEGGDEEALEESAE